MQDDGGSLLMATAESRHRPLILASSSPRRRTLLTEAGYEFSVIDPPIGEPERLSPDVPPTHQAEAISYFKARAVAAQLESGVVLAADTIVACRDTVFGKPIDIDDARRILSALVGEAQNVVTGVTLLDAATQKRSISHDVTTVWMRSLPDEAVERYLASRAWVGKAGAYGIQDQADPFVERIAGSFTNVVGLPMELVAPMLGEWGFPAPIRTDEPAEA